MGTALLGAQTLARAAVVPGLSGAASVVVGLLPATLVVVLPVAVLVGFVAAAQAWAEGGDLLGLACSGSGARRLVLPVLGAGLLLGGVEAVSTHHLEPHGRARARQALAAARGELNLRAGQPVSVGDALLHAERVSTDGFDELFLVSGTVAVAAVSGHVEAGGVLVLNDGSARTLLPGWQVRFAGARLPLPSGAPRLESADRSTGSLWGLVERMEANGRDASAERLALYKRTVLPLSVPLLALLGLPLGARRVRPAVAAVAVTLSWWLVMRIFDHLVQQVGPLSSAGVPLAMLALFAAAAWASWRER